MCLTRSVSASVGSFQGRRVCAWCLCDIESRRVRRRPQICRLCDVRILNGWSGVVNGRGGRVWVVRMRVRMWVVCVWICRMSGHVSCHGCGSFRSWFSWCGIRLKWWVTHIVCFRRRLGTLAWPLPAGSRLLCDNYTVRPVLPHLWNSLRGVCFTGPLPGPGLGDWLTSGSVTAVSTMPVSAAAIAVLDVRVVSPEPPVVGVSACLGRWFLGDGYRPSTVVWSRVLSGWRCRWSY